MTLDVKGDYTLKVSLHATVLALVRYSFLLSFKKQGSHSTWKTWKIDTTPGKPGNIMEF